MDLFYKEASENTPLISLNFKKGLFIIDGQFTLDEPESFFKPIEKNIKQYIKKPCKNTVLTINLSAINISSSTFLLNLIELLDQLYEKNYDVKVRWVYNNDEDGNFELGNDYADMVKVPFEFIETVQNFMTTI
tara:strand:- start:1278 stop:1676 length:399 start_codon:yes stop_codon:yes gene_type:complete